jgi:succinate dehydrogenase/fumarate reductase cytochrome b subunit
MLGIFTTIHLANTSVIPLVTGSVSASETYLLQAREIYQTPLTEPILITIPILTHIASGVSLRFLRRSLNIRRYGYTQALPSLESSPCSDEPVTRDARAWLPLSPVSISGYAFATLLGAHVLLNRVLPLHIEGDSSNVGLAFVAHGFARHKLIAYVSYGGLILAGCSHMVWGAARWLGLPTSLRNVYGDSSEGSKPKTTTVNKLARRKRRRLFYGTQALALGLAIVWACGSFGIVARDGLTDGWVGELYDSLLSEIKL